MRVSTTPSGIAIATQNPVFRCVIPTDEDGTPCGEPLYTERDRRAHIATCSARHSDFIANYGPRKRLSFLHDPNEWDPEYEREVLENAIVEETPQGPRWRMRDTQVLAARKRKAAKDARKANRSSTRSSTRKKRR